MNCKTCGEVVSAASKFCDVCGTSVDPSSGQQADEVQAETSTAHSSWPASPAVTATADPILTGAGTARTTSTATGSPPRGVSASGVTPRGVTASGVAARLPGAPVVMCDGEQVLRVYRAVQLRNAKRGEGTLYVTDARVVFYARAQGRGAQRASALVQQTRLQDITGLAAFVSRRISPLLLVLTVLFALVALSGLVSRALLLTIIALIVVGLCIAAIAGGAAERGRAGVTIHSMATQVSPITFGTFSTYRSPLEAFFGALFSPLHAIFRAHTAFDVLVGRPGEDSDQLISELGALILDQQTRGSLSAEHWNLEQVPVQRGLAN